MASTSDARAHSGAPAQPESNSPSLEAVVEEASEALSEHVHKQIQARPWFRRVAQVGWLAKGIVYASLGWAAIEIALAKSAPDEAEYTGIVAALADGSITRVLLAVIAIGLIFYIAFRLTSVALIDEIDLNAWAHRVAYLASVFTYSTIAWAAAAAVIAGTSESGESSVERISKQLLGNELGRIALGIGGTIALGIAVYFVTKGVTRSFMSQIDVHDLGTNERRVIEYTGAIGWIGRGLTVGVVASFITWAAIDADPNDARGIDSSMHRVASGNIGQLVVMVLGISLIVYASYCIISARRRRLAWEDNPEPATKSQRSSATLNRSTS